MTAISAEPLAGVAEKVAVGLVVEPVLLVKRVRVTFVVRNVDKLVNGDARPIVTAVTAGETLPYWMS
jgi:hypothetical protein